MFTLLLAATEARLGFPSHWTHKGKWEPSQTTPSMLTDPKQCPPTCKAEPKLLSKVEERSRNDADVKVEFISWKVEKSAQRVPCCQAHQCWEGICSGDATQTHLSHGYEYKPVAYLWMTVFLQKIRPILAEGQSRDVRGRKGTGATEQGRQVKGQGQGAGTHCFTPTLPICKDKNVGNHLFFFFFF